MAWKRWARWAVLVGVLAVTFGRWCLRAIAMDEPPISRLTLVPRYGEPEVGRDLEIRVAAPETARAVTVALPNGEILSTRYDSDRGVWSRHFFVDAGTCEGTRMLGISIVSESGTGEGTRLRCATSPHAPVVGISLERVGAYGNDVAITARSVVVAEGRTNSGTAARLVECPRHVEVRMPDRRLVILGFVGDGVFRGYWRSSRRFGGPLRIRVVSVDRALHERASEMSVGLPPTETADSTSVLATAPHP